jgi:hypothetical protein
LVEATMTAKPAAEAQLQERIGKALHEPDIRALLEPAIKEGQSDVVLASRLAHSLVHLGATIDPLEAETARRMARLSAFSNLLGEGLGERFNRYVPGRTGRSAAEESVQSAQQFQRKTTDVSPIAQLVQGISEKTSDRMPWRISTRDLSRHTTKVLTKLQEDQRAAVITYRGVPAFMVLPIDQSDVFTLFLSNAPKLREDHEAARAELTEGEDGAEFFS